jgi:hypothetical protein
VTCLSKNYKILMVITWDSSFLHVKICRVQGFPLCLKMSMKMDIHYTLPKKQGTGILDNTDVPIVIHYSIALTVWRMLRWKPETLENFLSHLCHRNILGLWMLIFVVVVSFKCYKRRTVLYSSSFSALFNVRFFHYLLLPDGFHG